MKDKELLLGVFTDAHYARRTDAKGERFFQESLGRVQDCMSKFIAADVDAVICLGDMIDWRIDGGSVERELDEMIAAIHSVEPRDIHLVLGNHDVEAMEKYRLLERCNFYGRNNYYSFDLHDLHFVILDTNFDADGNPYGADYMVWDYCYVDEQQLKWLKADLSAAKYPTVILTHANLDGRAENGIRNPHVVVNHDKVRAVLKKYGNVKTVLQGHDHQGWHGKVDGISYITLPAMVEGENRNYALLLHFADDGTISKITEVYPNGVFQDS